MQASFSSVGWAAESLPALAAYESGVPLAGAKRSVPNFATVCWARYALPNLRCYPALLAFALAWPASAGDLVVVAGAHSPLHHLSREQVADIYMGRVTTLPGGTSAIPLDLPASSPEREAFYNEITGKSAAQIKVYWARMSFTGKGTPPKQVPSSADIKKFAGAKPGAIAYLAKDALDGSVKVLFSLK